MENKDTKVKKQMQISILDDMAVVTMIGYHVTNEAKVKVDLPEFMLKLPGGHTTPDWIIKNAVASLWITIQGKLRPMAEKDILEIMRNSIECDDLSKTFESKRVVKDPEAEVKKMLKSGKLTAEQILAILEAENRGVGRLSSFWSAACPIMYTSC